VIIYLSIYRINSSIPNYTRALVQEDRKQTRSR